jgi:two-component system chemotaxis response regulator CheY
MKILIAEDDLVTRALLRRLLSNLSHDVVEAGDGLAALEKIESDDPDLLLTDLHMPQLDGRTLIETVRSSKVHGKLPIVCMSAVKDKNEIVGLISLGIQGYILKPINPADVRERMQKVIADYGSWRPLTDANGPVTLMLVDPDVKFREFARDLLQARFTVVEATSGAHALRLFKEGDATPSVVIVAKGLPLVDEVKLMDFIRAHAETKQVAPPKFWLLSDDDEPASSLPASFAGHIKRSFEADAFSAELTRTVLEGQSLEPSSSE